MLKKLFIALIPFIIFTSCNTKKSEKAEANMKIQKLESEIIADTTGFINKKGAKQLLELYDDYAKKYEMDSLAPRYLFKAGELAMNLNFSTKALDFLNRLENKYPKSAKMPYCIFFQAFIYENQLKNLGQAKIYYQKFIDNYPTHELVDDAKISISNLGKSLDDIIKGFDEQKKDE
ncbi:MAG: tetratricopeptide repeat protein [Chlorobi bacterium]|nr:tetratricopeptide repeat protein [Chlorobiota bacterium]